jgi:Tfp pilus assembly protein PilW
MKFFANERGTSLVEVLVALVFVVLLGAMSHAWMRAILFSARVQEVAVKAHEAAIMAADVFVREVRMAGFSAGAEVEAVGGADATFVRVAADFNGDGDVADAHETIAYAYDAAKHRLTRATGGGRPQPFVSDVAEAGVVFSFFDAAARQLVPAAAELGSGDRSRVRRIDLALEIEASIPGQPQLAPVHARISTSAFLRNG